jgi:hypothetical protein
MSTYVCATQSLFSNTTHTFSAEMKLMHYANLVLLASAIFVAGDSGTEIAGILACSSSSAK